MHRLLQKAAVEFSRDHDWSLLSLGCAAGFELLLGDAAFCGEHARYPVPRDRVGIDLDPVDLDDDDALLWLRACSDANAPEVTPLVARARDRLALLEHETRAGDATDLLATLPDRERDVLVVSHQFLCSVNDPAFVADAVRESPQVQRWLSVEVPSTASRAYEVVGDYPPSTPLATVLDGDLRVLRQEPLPDPR